MRILILVVLLAFSANQEMHAQRSLSQKKDTRSFWERLFQPPKKVLKKAPRRQKAKRVKSESEKSSPGGKGSFTVDAEWMARYWELEAAWDYPIPEDNDIQFKDGKYHVPPVVYRHYEDMHNARRASNP